MASRGRARFRPSHTLNGYFLPPENEDDYDIDDNDMSDDDDFPDLSDVEFGGSRAKSQPLKYVVARFMDHGSRRELKVKGLFPMDDPWWSATIKAEKGNAYYFMKGYPVYKLRTDAQVGPQGIVSLFMRACRVDDDAKTAFYDFLRSQGRESKVTFDNLRDHLEEFEKADEVNSVPKMRISSAIDSPAGPGLLVWGSLEDGDIFAILPQLLPRKFRTIMEVSKSDKELLPKLRKLLDTEPWVLGFGRVFARREIGIKGIEVTLKAFLESGLIDKLTPVQKDALHIYDVMKNSCRRFGHTYLVDRLFRRSQHFQEFPISDWNRAYHFMEKEEIIKTEQKDGDLRIYLFKHWFAEDSIAKNISRILQRHQEDPWKFDIDYTNPLFETILTDPDQKRAADLISQQPVVALSGRGGCGKTTVVSQVFQYAQQLLAREHLERYTKNQFKADDIDDLMLTQTADKLEATQDNADQSGCNDSFCLLSDNGTGEAESASQPGPSNLQPPEPSLLQQQEDWEKKSEPDGTNSDAEPVILLTAPTGKAAHLLGRRTHLPSFTLHQVTYSFNHWNKLDKWKYRHVRVLVVDECSLVPVSVFSWLLYALVTEANLQKIVLLGDVSQLPSIEPGNFLSDTYRSFQLIHCSVLLQTNHRAESQLIVDNAGLIAMKKNPVIDPNRNFHQITLAEQGYGISDENDDLVLSTSEAIKKLLQQNVPALGGHEKSQFVAFRRKDCLAINEACCRHYSNHPITDSKGKPDFQVGDKVCCSKNALITDHLSEKPVRLCNGEIFFIEADTEVKEDCSQRRSKKRFLTLRMDKDTAVKVDFNQVLRDCKLKHAWARTIHTYQGSESDTVIYVVGRAGGQTWQHAYTAVTRGRKQVILITRQSQLEASIRKDPIPRQTSLGERLCRVISKMSQDQQKNGHASKSADAPPQPLSEHLENSPYQAVPEFVTAKHLLCLAQKEMPTSANNSQTFSDWGDGDMDALLDLEQTAMGESLEKLEGANGGSLTHRMLGSKQQTPAELPLDEVLALEEEIQAELVSGNKFSSCIPLPEEDIEPQSSDFQDSETTFTDSPLPSSQKRAVKNLFGKTRFVSKSQSTDFFPTEKDFFTSILDHGISSTAVKSNSKSLTNSQSSKDNEGIRDEYGDSFANPSRLIHNSPGKRQLPIEGDSLLPSKKKQLTEGPVTDSFVSPLRRTLGGFSLSEEDDTDHEQRKF